jgi:hypothetical protein
MYPVLKGQRKWRILRLRSNLVSPPVHTDYNDRQYRKEVVHELSTVEMFNRKCFIQFESGFFL